MKRTTLLIPLVLTLFLSPRVADLNTTAGLVREAAAAEEDAKEFYKGKRINLLVQYTPGGSADLHSRWLARHLPRFTGAKAIVQNQPGAGGVIAYNKLYKMRPDGLTLLTAHTKLIAFEIFKRKGVRYKFDKFVVLGRTLEPETALLIEKGLPVDLGQLRKMERIRIGESSPFYGGLFAEALGLSNITIVPGYPGFGGRVAAIRRGELEGSTGSITGAVQYPDAISVLSTTHPDPRKPDAPVLREVNADKRWADYLTSFSGLMWTIVTSPGVPRERALFLQNALRQVAQDRKALAEAKKMKLRIGWEPPSKVVTLRKVFDQLGAEERREIQDITEKKYVGAIR